MMSRRQLAAQWGKERQEVADAYFAGSVEQADNVLNALPFSSIPTWEDVRNVMDALAA